ncbi:stage II sporulation protein P [Tyzzerella sp. OttesenSCG-928-J15]|nr:stage II sporulation protein P [Tyzzerella sp. OttesenSCG-928-J15]
MTRRGELKFKYILKKAAQGIVLSGVMAGLLFAFAPEETFALFLAKEILPIYNKESGEAFLKFYTKGALEFEEEVAEDESNWQGSVVEEIKLVESVEYIEENAAELNEPEKQIIGINDIVFQNEDEFGPMPDGAYKENFTAENIDRLYDREYFISSFYNKDSKTGVITQLFDPVKFFNTNLKEVKNTAEPQVLIFHTHGGTEYFIDSNTGDLSEGIMGAGERLKYVLENKYGITAIHHTGIFDMVDGRSARDGSYERMEPDIEKILAENPSIKVVIDLHRDGIEPNPNLVTYIDDKPCAKIMFVNGVSAIQEGDEIKSLNYLKNENLESNLAFSFNMQIAANELYPEFTRKILLKPYRFSTHMRAKSLLVEVGSQYNTKEEVFNSMEILADLIESVVFK